MKTGILKRRHRDEIINSLSTLMLVHTSHPTPDDYTTVCRRLVEKYPNLKDKVDSGYVSTSDKSFNNYVIFVELMEEEIKNEVQKFETPM